MRCAPHPAVQSDAPNPDTCTRGITPTVTMRLGVNMLQKGVPINEGNSGGPLISLETGQVVGINTAKVKEESVEGLCFAVPMLYACTILDLLRAGCDPSPPAGTSRTSSYLPRSPDL